MPTPKLIALHKAACARELGLRARAILSGGSNLASNRRCIRAIRHRLRIEAAITNRLESLTEALTLSAVAGIAPSL